MTSSSITVTFSGPSDRWIAFGLGTAMYNTDVFIYSNGKPGALHTVGWKDYYNTSSLVSGVNNDFTQNWNIVSTGTVAPGTRTVVATRALSTGDANDVVVNFTSNALNLVWAKGATSDYTIAYHGSNSRAYGISLDWLSTPTASFTSASTTVCAGASLTYSNQSTGGQTSYTWAFQGGNPATSTATNPSVVYQLPGTYSVVLTASNSVGTHSVAMVNYVTVTPTIATGVTISQITGSNPICSGVPATFSATPTNGGTSPSYQWFINGLATGVTTPSYTSSGLNNQSQITSVMLSNAACASPASATSAAITLTVNSSAAATATISIIAGSNPICNGSMVVFSVTAGNGGTAPGFQWKVNGLNVGNNATYSTTSLLNGDVVTAVVSSNAPCASTTLATSPAITMSVSGLLTPSVSIAIISGTNPLCAGSQLTFSASAVNGGATPVFQWKVNNVNAGNNSAIFTVPPLGNGSVVQCVMSSALSCASPNTATSTAITLTVNPIPPAPIVTASGPVTFCAGNSVTLTASSTSGNLWSNGSITPSIQVSSSGNFLVSQTVNGCISLASSITSVVVNSLPIVNISAINNVCVAASSLVLTQGSPAGGTYSVNSASSLVFAPTQIGTYTIQYVYQDANGCSNTASVIAIAASCTGLNENKTLSTEFILFPNPTTGKILIEGAMHNLKSATVTDVNGRIIMVKNLKGVQTLEVDLSHEKNGIYMIEVILENSIYRSKIIKQD